MPMAPILRQSLPLYPTAEHTGMSNATLVLCDDRFMIIRPSSTPEPADIVLDTPLRKLTVSGSMSYLIFTVGDVAYRVEFDASVAGVLATSDSGTSDAKKMLQKSGINDWLKELRARKVPVEYKGIGSIWKMAWAMTAVIVGGSIIYVVGKAMI
jgi:hypothetical protein